MITDKKVCLHCTRPISGRSDKKFCDDYCRSAVNNKKKSIDVYRQWWIAIGHRIQIEK